MNNWILRLEGVAVALFVVGEIGLGIFAAMGAAVLHIVNRYK